MRPSDNCTAFAGNEHIASGPLTEVAIRAKAVLDADQTARILIFDAVTAEPIEVDFRGTPDDVLRRIGHHAELSMQHASVAAGGRGRGRPRLGVVAREVTLLPRHWDWLGRQPGGASVVLRKLVEEARRSNGAKDVVREAREVAYRFMSAMAGNEPDFEEATRALFAGNKDSFDQAVAAWPPDIRDHATSLADAGFAQQP